jgi:hypothetical protein
MTVEKTVTVSNPFSFLSRFISSFTPPPQHHQHDEGSRREEGEEGEEGQGTQEDGGEEAQGKEGKEREEGEGSSQTYGVQLVHKGNFQRVARKAPWQTCKRYIIKTPSLFNLP